MTPFYMNQRRLRANAHVRELAATVCMSYRDMIQPIFVEEDLLERVASASMSGVFTDTETSVLTQIAADVAVGVHKFLLFPIPTGRFETDFDFGFAQRIVQSIKATFGDTVWLACDLCLCSYTTHGHCGVLNAEKTRLQNAETVRILAQYALTLAKAGADCIAPSDMTDGRIGAIRTRLDTEGYDVVSIMAYSSKFSSNFYGPFRDVCKSSPDKTLQLKDRKTYQIDPCNLNDALASSFRDAEEGADFLMIKPALPYLDILTRLSERINVPCVVYHVSGEYAAIDLLEREKLIDKAAAHIELWTAFKRAGATAIITYSARDARKWLDGF
jgi:porphobilinogen synthase